MEMSLVVEMWFSELASGTAVLYESRTVTCTPDGYRAPLRGFRGHSKKTDVPGSCASKDLSYRTDDRTEALTITIHTPQATP